MLKIHTDNISLGASAADKTAAIRLIANKLSDAGFVKSGYVDGMLAREQQSSTYLGNAIAIPHGTTDTRDQVEQTGLQLVQFPQGVDWGEGNIVYLAIGIAAQSDEHLTILRQLTRVLDQDNLDKKLKDVTDPQVIVDLLSGNASLKFDTDCIVLDFPVSNLIQLQAVGAGQLKQTGIIGDQGITELMSATPTPLNDGVLLSSSSQDVQTSGISIIRAQQPFDHDGLKVQTLISVATKDDKAKPVLEKLVELLNNNQLSKLNEAKDNNELLSLLSDNTAPAQASDAPAQDLPEGAEQEVVKLKNPHGLHARPGAVLVKAIKEYDVKITVENLTEGTGPVNGRSLMKVIGLGAQYNHELRFTAEGENARQALDHIKEAINAGLGEKL
ncbi:fused PTS fructose transporter subunit IIA/HPr protein [Celerinatantimonas diazotrophica]|uniref:Phosphocarrier protein HPr /PTS system D-fructose-specific IIA component (F1P-forming) (Frc family) n=1 Tax=Celerinatantimonas diazotrophica TaxID=412034 RepID=A0A4R1KDW9_9GAMM|nr:fused PTS fructose transporter subunit IIA/HPr protein [Celerinatantimonas diazotrophica]TCK62764.1 phosphocarrier protein HPr /PTS system D-fructose-specific IIA component (F1P-forming) (Frc family) [Celerinatantimonas diazotrophica]CAG9298394.1 Multiphosphoryl transfer protein [Celerinatantimonas diazotrophica]